MTGPCKSCTNSGSYQVIRELNGGRYCHCPKCNRNYLLANMEIDAMCIEQISQYLWKEMPTDPGIINDPGLYILNHRPYFATSSDHPDNFVEITDSLR